MHGHWFWGLFSLALLCACGDDGIESPENRFSARDTFAVDVTKASRRELNLRGVNGSITVSGAPGAAAVSIFAVTRVEAESQADADAGISQIEVAVDSTDDAVLVETLQPVNTEGRNYTVDYTIALPTGFQVVVMTANGTTIVRRVNRNVAISAANGDVALDEIVGSAEVELANGSIDAQVTVPASGTIALSSGNGDIDLLIPRSTSAQFHAEAASGRVTVVGLDLQGAVVEPSRVTGTLGGGDGDISLIIANGDIYVEGF